MSNAVVKLHHATLKLASGEPAPVFLPLDRIAFFLRSQTGEFTNIQLNTMTDKVMPVIETEQEIIEQLTGEKKPNKKSKETK